MIELEVLEEAYESVPEPDAARIAESRRALLLMIAAERSRRPRLRERLRRVGTSRSRRLSVLIVAVVVAASLFAASSVYRDAPTGVGTAEAACRGSDVPAQPCLLALARIARGAAPRRGIVYQRTQDIYPMQILPPGSHGNGWPLAGVRRPFIALPAMVVETWIDPASGRGVRRIRPGKLLFSTNADRAAWRAAGSPTWQRVTGGRIPKGTFKSVADGEDLYLRSPRAWRTVTGKPHPGRALPSDPGALTRLLERVEAAIPRGKRFGWRSLVEDALPDPLLAPSQRAALMTVLMQDPHARLSGLMRDPLGRVGIAISTPYDVAKLPASTPDWVYLYDPRTSRLLAEGVDGRVVPDEVPGRVASRKHFEWLRVFEIARGTVKALPTVTGKR